MEDAGMAWAPVDVAARFGREHDVPECRGIDPFIFHKWRGANAAYPKFISPDKRIKNIVRKFLFWRYTKKWKIAHNIVDE